MRITICLFLVLIMVSCATAPMKYDIEPVDTEVWKQSFDEELSIVRFVDSTLVITSTEDHLFGINPTDGTTRWKRRLEPSLEDLAEEHRDSARAELKLQSANCKTTLAMDPNSKYAFVRRYITEEFRNRNSRLFRKRYNTLTVVDLSDGSELWNTHQIGVYSCVGYFLLPLDQGLLLGVQDESKNVWVMAVDLTTGNLLWENREFFKDCQPDYKVLWSCQPPLFDTKETMITFLNKEKIRKWEVRTGRMIWETNVDAKRSPDICYGFPPMMPSIDRSFIFVPCDKTVLAVDVQDGTLNWSKKPKLKGQLKQMTELPQGLLTRGGAEIGGGGDAFIDLLDPASGKSLWSKEFKKLKKHKSTNYIIKGDDVIVYSDKKMFKININDGSYSEIGKDLKFGGKETPVRLTTRNNNYQLLSAQNLMSVGRDGKPIFHAYLEAPKTSSLLKVASFAATVAIATAGAMATQGFISYGTTSYSIMPLVHFDLPQYGNSTDAPDYLFILTNIEPPGKTGGPRGPGLVKVDKDTGKAVAGIILGDKAPIYTLDTSLSRIFYVQDDHALVCAEF
jgi:outer membrane protein assembly factor BamB